MVARKQPSIVYWLGDRLYLNITNKCSNNCYFCIKNFRNGVGGFNLKLRRDPTVTEIISELREITNKKNWKEIVFCGFGEPTERLDCLLEVTRWIKRYYGKPASIRLDTNGQGYLLNKGRDVIKELQAAGVDKISASLNANGKDIYNQVCRPRFSDAYESVLEFIEKAKEDLHTEVTAVAIPEIDIQRVRDIAHNMGVKFRTREYIPCFF